MRKKNQSHDRYFKDLMEDVDFARKFLQTYLAAKVSAQVDWNTLTPYDTTLTGAHNKQLYADLVYKAYTKERHTEIYFILNHERKADKTLPIRNLEYLLATLKKTIKQQEGKPAFIVHLTWHNGQPGPYPYAKSIFEYFEEQDLARELLLESSQIINPHELADEELMSHEPTNVLEIFMKYADDPSFPKWIMNHPKMASQLAENKYIERSIDYLLEVGYHKEEDLLKAFEQSSAKLKQAMLTTRQQIEKRSRRAGRQEGVQQGMQARALEIAEQMLRAGEPQEKAIRFTGLRAKEVAKIAQKLGLYK